MTTKHQPLQPLPFSTGSLNKTIAAADGEYVAETASIQDSEYLTHAANAYPKLVEALRQMRAFARVGGPFHGTRGQRIEEAGSLLRELGED